MANLQGVNYAKSQSNPIQMIDMSDRGGKLRVSYDSYTFLAEAADGDSISMGSPIPAGARIIDAWVQGPDLGTVGSFKFGHSSDDDALVAAFAVTAAFKAKMAAEAGLFQVLDDAIQPLITMATAADAATGLEIKSCVMYVLD